jgi:acyl-CoA thioesterase-1
VDIVTQLGFFPANSTVKDRIYASFIAFLLVSLACLFFILNPAAAQAETIPKRIVVLGDSLTSGYGLESGYGFPEQLETILNEDGYNVKIENAGISGDTTAGGLSRYEWSIEGDVKPSLVIVALGANDMLRGLPVDQTKSNLSAIIKGIQSKDIPVLLAGMRAPLNYTGLFSKGFNSIYPNIAEELDVELYPFFLEGVALKPALNQADGIHPNRDGVKVMADNIKPYVVKFLK